MDRPTHGFRSTAERPDGAAGLHPLVAVKLWDNPCCLSFRLNYLALSFNTPIYGWIEAHYRLTRPEFAVIYSLSLKDGVAAKDVCSAFGFPKNTISRAIQLLLKRALVCRAPDESDRRSFVLKLVPAGRRIVAGAMPAMIERERVMLSSLTQAEQHMLLELMSKMVMNSSEWPAAIDMEAQA
jgi:MarR family transcriptional regulator, temperature-dependent positive regulator of motility